MSGDAAAMQVYAPQTALGIDVLWPFQDASSLPCWHVRANTSPSGPSAYMQAMPASLVAGLFDQYANKFDQHLVTQLQYRTPEMLM